MISTPAVRHGTVVDQTIIMVQAVWVECIQRTVLVDIILITPHNNTAIMVATIILRRVIIINVTIRI